jgi:predicted alpha/beta superfamily hydrolase
MKREADRAAGAERSPIHFPPSETHLIRSQYVQQTFKVQVMRPARSEGDTSRYPVVYVTDGNLVFAMFETISKLIQLSKRDAPPFILVGIGYPSDFPLAGTMLRVRDFSFPRYPKFSLAAAMPPWEGVMLAEEGTKATDGGEDFQRFIGDELIPFIDETYETTPGDRTYFGHSGGGVFGLFTLFSKPNLFRNYIVSSPALSYHGDMPGGFHYENYDFAFDEAREFIAAKKPVDGISIYMSAGAEEEYEPELAQWRLTSSVLRMAALMHSARVPGLRLMTEIFPGETHMTVWPMAFIHGVQAVFGTRRVLNDACGPFLHG